MSDLEVNDPVHVEREGGQLLHGVVAYLGPVSFASGDDWVGVRLTGAFAGLGKNDGSVKGQRYFNCGGPKDGVFVKKSNVKKRTLSKIEGLRLKREIAKFQEGADTSAPTTPANRASSRTPGSAISSKSSATKPRKTGIEAPSGASATSKTRLAELKARREAAMTRGSTSQPPSTVSVVQPAEPQVSKAFMEEQVSGLEAELDEVKKQLEAMKTQLEETSTRLRVKEEEAASLQQSLSKAEQDVHDARSRMEELEDEIKSIPPPVEAPAPAQTGSESSNAQEELMHVREELARLKQDHRDQMDSSTKAQDESKRLQQELEREREGRASDVEALKTVRSEVATLQHQLNAINEQQNVRSSSDAVHYKERAKLQAEITSWKSKVEQVQEEKVELEQNVEELTLDKEQLQEEKEALQDRLEELNIDAETAQMEVEELKMELEDAKASAERAVGSSGVVAAASENDDAIRSLTIQNSRLREALIRLREQSAIEKMDAAKQLRDAEKDATKADDLAEQLKKMHEQKTGLDEQVSDLKEMVEQGSAFEGMVEDLSDRVMELEDTNVALQTTIRELEEGNDLAAEMEEVQADEMKALMRDVEGRDTIIRNLEEAIKMQRRREEDFQRTVSNYRTTVETLKQEKTELLSLQQGGEGEKNDLLATSQKALARAAQLVADAAKARKKAAEAAFAEIEGIGFRHIAVRLESMLPMGVTSAELGAIKGEMLLCQIAIKGAKTLEGLTDVFGKTIASAASATMQTEVAISASDFSFTLSDDAAQLVESMLHQSQYALSMIRASSELIRLLAAGQWPDLLDTSRSAELGSLFGHCLGSLDNAMTVTLKTLKEEGALSPHQSNLGAFNQSFQTALQAINGEMREDGNPIVSPDWQPPSWNLLKSASVARMTCLGASAAVAAAVSPDDLVQGSGSASGQTKSFLKSLMASLDQVSSQAKKVSLRLSKLDVRNEKVTNGLTTGTDEWMSKSMGLLDTVKNSFVPGSQIASSQVAACESQADAVLKAISAVNASLRAAKLNNEEIWTGHPLSVECVDVWEGMSILTQDVRSVDGDNEDVNYLVRARGIENRLDQAVENEPKLVTASNRISTLEKSLETKSKEIAMQNARISELEKFLAKSSVQAVPRETMVEVTSSEELKNLKDEIRVLTEAMEVLQIQTDEYEAEIQSLKNPKTPKSRATPRKARGVFDTFASPTRARMHGSRRGDIDETSTASISAIQAAMFRPALDEARKKASKWKAQAIASGLSSLPPLDVPFASSSEESKSMEPDEDPMTELARATSRLRMAQASISVVDLTGGDLNTAKADFHRSLLPTLAAEAKVREATAKVTQWLSQTKSQSAIGSSQEGDLLGRVKFNDGTSTGKVSVHVSMNDLQSIHRSVLMGL